MGKIAENQAADAFGVEPQEVDVEFVAWMTQHEESYRKAWVYDEIWADESVALIPQIFIVKNGVVNEAIRMTGFFGKWEKVKSSEMEAYGGFPIADIGDLFPGLKFVARRAINTMSKEVLYYAK